MDGLIKEWGGESGLSILSHHERITKSFFVSTIVENATEEVIQESHGRSGRSGGRGELQEREGSGEGGGGE